MIITTLPICFRRGRPFRILFSAFVAKCLGRLLSSKVYYPINLMGIKNHLIPDEIEPTRLSYHTALRDIGIDVSVEDIMSDMDEMFLHYVRDIIESRIYNQICTIEPVPMAYCICGRVELPASVLQQLREQERAKLTKFVEGKLRCSICNEEIQYCKYNVLLHQHGDVAPEFSIFPSWLKTRKDEELERILKRRCIVTRRYRPSGVSLQLSSGLTVDPDYCWGHQLAFLSKISCDNELVLVIGMTHIAQACKAIMLAKMARPEIKVSLVVHPMVDFHFNNPFPNPTMSAGEFVRFCGSKSAALIMLSFALQWNRERSSLNFEELPLIENSLRNKIILMNLLKQSNIGSIEDAVRALKRFNVQTVLKGLRQRRILSAFEQILIQAIVV